MGEDRIGYVDNGINLTRLNGDGLPSYTTLEMRNNDLTEDSDYLQKLENRIICLEYENSELKKSLQELKEILKLKPQIDSLLNYYKIDLLEKIN